MATSTMINVGENFDLDLFSQRLADTYQQKGFTVQSMNMGGSTRIVFDKDAGNIITALGLGITANCIVNNGTLLINYSDGAWVSKLIAWLTNFLLLFIPFIGWILLIVRFGTILVGCYKQYGLPKEIENDATVIASNMASNQNAGAQGYGAQPAQAYQQPSQAPVSSVENDVAVWTCSCGKTDNTGAFCAQCGSPRP